MYQDLLCTSEPIPGQGDPTGWFAALGQPGATCLRLKVEQHRPNHGAEEGEGLLPQRKFGGIKVSVKAK